MVRHLGAVKCHLFTTAEKSSPVGAGDLVTKWDTCVQLPTSGECGTQVVMGRGTRF
jgi:hypothetical protein